MEEKCDRIMCMPESVCGDVLPKFGLCCNGNPFQSTARGQPVVGVIIRL